MKLQSLVANLLGIGICLLVLAAFLFPIFAPHHSYHNVSCLSNVKQLGVGLLMYRQDYDERFPPAATWMDATYLYTKNTEIYRCTSIEKTHKTEFGYAFNSTLDRKVLEKRQTPANVITLYDSNDLRWNANAPGRAGVANPPRHSGGNMFGFADGHAKFRKLVETDN